MQELYKKYESLPSEVLVYEVFFNLDLESLLSIIDSGHKKLALDAQKVLRSVKYLCYELARRLKLEKTGNLFQHVPRNYIYQCFYHKKNMEIYYNDSNEEIRFGSAELSTPKKPFWLGLYLDTVKNGQYRFCIENFGTSITLDSGTLVIKGQTEMDQLTKNLAQRLLLLYEEYWSQELDPKSALAKKYVF